MRSEGEIMERIELFELKISRENNNTIPNRKYINYYRDLINELKWAIFDASKGARNESNK